MNPDKSELLTMQYTIKSNATLMRKLPTVRKSSFGQMAQLTQKVKGQATCMTGSYHVALSLKAFS